MLKTSAPSRSIAPGGDRRLDVRYVGPISGCYVLSDRREIVTGDVEVFACRTQSISGAAAAITAPVIGAIGEPLTARFERIGILRGTITRHTSDGFVFEIVASDQHRARLAAKVDWLKKKSVRKQSELREYKRFQPRDPRSTLGLGDGRVCKCFIIDLSRSGAAVSCQYVPRIGETLVLGTLTSQVVRRLDVGFAVQFEAVQEQEGLEQLVTGFEPVSTPGPDAGPAAPSD